MWMKWEKKNTYEKATSTVAMQTKEIENIERE